MKSSTSYVKKYNLKSGVKFSHDKFVEDLSQDFDELVEERVLSQEYYDLMQKRSEQSNDSIMELDRLRTYHGRFKSCVNDIRKKYDGISNKTLGQLPKPLWNFFFATVVKKKESTLFPDYAHYIEKEEKEEEKAEESV